MCIQLTHLLVLATTLGSTERIEITSTSLKLKMKQLPPNNSITINTDGITLDTSGNIIPSGAC